MELLSEEVDQRYKLVTGTSKKLAAALDIAGKAAATKSTVLLLGESGVGKELFARAIHNWSDRKDRAFVAINCVGLSKELLESELFGYERGAFTGAQHSKRRGKLSWPMAERFSWMRSATSPKSSKPNSCGSSRSGNLSA